MSAVYFTFISNGDVLFTSSSQGLALTIVVIIFPLTAVVYVYGSQNYHALAERHPLKSVSMETLKSFGIKTYF